MTQFDKPQDSKPAEGITPDKEQAADPSQLTPVPDPIQPKADPADLPKEGQEIPTIHAVDFENLPVETKQDPTPVLKPTED